MSDSMFLITGIIAGGLITWFSSNYHYKKSQRDSERTHEKTLKEIRKSAIRTITDELKITKKKAEKIIVEIFSSASEKYGIEYMRYKCPKCGSSQTGFAEISNGDQSADIEYCEKCGFDKF